MSDVNSKVWAIVELMGHQRIAGQLSEHNIGGSFLRVDVPAVNGRQGFTKLYGQSAIYAISFVDEDTALAAAEHMQAVPVTPYSVGQLTSDAVRQRLQNANAYSKDEWEDDVI